MNTQPLVTPHQLREAIDELDLANSPICIHSSLRSFGRLEGGPESLLEVFAEAGCTVIVPTFSWAFFVPPPINMRPPQNGWDYDRPSDATTGTERIYTTATNEVDEDMGAIPRALLNTTGCVRGQHPLCSFAAIGPLATQIIRPQTPTDVMAPLRELANASGKVLSIGVDLTRLTLLHLAEEVAGRALFVRWANGPDGSAAGVRVGGCSEGFEQLRPSLESLATRTAVGASLWTAYPAREALALAAEAASRPEITHCGQTDCERCNDAVLGGPD